MKKQITTLFLALSTLGMSQTYNFKPEWKKGDERTVHLTQVEKEYENDELISNLTTTYDEAVLKVIDETDEFYTLEVNYEDQTLKALEDLNEELAEKLKQYKGVQLEYSINKQTGEASLNNWEEARDRSLNSLNSINEIVEASAPDFAPFLSVVLNPLKEVFSSKENVEAYMSNYIGYLLVPYNQSLEVGNRISVEEMGANPFNPNQEIKTTTHLTLKNVDEKIKVCNINQEIEFDLTAFIAAMKDMMKGMMESFGVDEEKAKEQSKEFDNFEMDMANTMQIEFDYKSSWVKTAVGEVLVLSTDPRDGKKKKKEVVITRILD